MARTSKIGTLINKQDILKQIAKADSLETLRANAMPVIKEACLQAQETLQQRFSTNSNCSEYIAANAKLIDTVIEILSETATPHLKENTLAIIAVGGYGRNELFPYSDIDL